MKTILCYGDSNTYGYDPSNGLRYPKSVRWTGVLAELLGPDYAVVEEGCNGRTTVFDDPLEGWKNGLDYLKPCLNSHKPVDLVILMLGSNDLKDCFHASAAQIADGAGVLVKTMQAFTQLKQGYVPEILLVSPPRIGPDILRSPFSYAFDETAVERSRLFAQEYGRVAAECGCAFFDAAPLAPPSELDSLHLMPQAHRALAEGLADAARTLLKEE